MTQKLFKIISVGGEGSDKVCEGCLLICTCTELCDRVTNYWNELCDYSLLKGKCKICSGPVTYIKGGVWCKQCEYSIVIEELAR